MTFILGITGGIASGKTTATQTLETLGIQVVDADVIARDIVSKDSLALKKITQHFGSSILLGSDSDSDPDSDSDSDSDSLDSGELNRTRLREIIFSDPEEKHWLEHLLHPLVRDEIIRQLSTITSPYGVLSSPLLFEKNQHSLVDRTVVIDTPTSTQKIRAAQRDNTDQQQIERIIHAQLSREERNKKADDVIMNIGNLDELQQAMTAYHHQLLPKVYHHMTKELSCPQCKKKVLWNAQYPNRPFCSKRCQLIDLGEWANESFSIPVSEENNHDGTWE